MNFTISRKIYAALGAILLIFLVMFGLLLRDSYEQTSSFAARYRYDIEAAAQLARAQDASWQLRMGEGADAAKLRDTVADALARFDKTGIDDDQRQSLAAVRTSSSPAIAVKRLGELAALTEQAAARHIVRLTDSAGQTQIATVGMFLIGAVLAVVAALWLVRTLVPRLLQARLAAERVAGGDLTGRVQSHSKDEAGDLLDAIGKMNAGLAGVVTQVRSSADSVVSTASQVAAGTTDLSQRTEEQASSLQETAASMEELASTVNQNADNARQADELARSVSKRAEQGGAEVGRAVATMNEVSQSAGRIADIISVIDGIAFQTNILALNAAVEAARAGEQGRGFAVVAAEVRSLAQRSAQAAREIKGLIHDSVERSRNGTQLVEQAGRTIHTLVSDVKRVSELMGSIAEASAEQSRGVQQVNKTVTEMDRVVQQNAAAVQQVAMAAESMRGQARTLYDAVAAFRLDHHKETSVKDLLDSLSHRGPSVPALAYAR